MQNKIELGKYGENIAVQYLKQKNYKIITQNFRCKQGEIDIIAEEKKNKEIVFIEVKTRTNLNYGVASEAVNNIKINHIYKTAQYYILKNKIQNKSNRIDVIEIYITNSKRLEKNQKELLQAEMKNEKELENNQKELLQAEKQAEMQAKKGLEKNQKELKENQKKLEKESNKIIQNPKKSIIINHIKNII